MHGTLFPPHSKTYDPSILGRQLGILRIVVEDGTTVPHYIYRGRPPFQGNATYDLVRTTIDRQEALLVCFVPSPEPHPIGCLNTAYGLLDFSLYYHPADIQQHTLYLGSGVVAIPKEGQHSGYVSKVWNVASDGSLEASLSGPFDPTIPSSCKANKRQQYPTTNVTAAMRSK